MGWPPSPTMALSMLSDEFYGFFFFNINCDNFFNTYLFPYNSISLIISKLIRNLTFSQLKILYIYNFLSVFLYIYMHNFFIYGFFLSLFPFFFLNFLELETLLIILINFFSPIINNKFVSLFLFAVKYFIKITLLQVYFYSLFLFLWFCL